LKAVDIMHIPRTLEKYDEELRKKTGCTLLEIAEDAAGTGTAIRGIMRKSEAAVVPITSGRGVIGGFSEAVAAILNHIGIKAVLTQEVDVSGIAEAYELDADLIFSADDSKFVAINTCTKRVVDNAASTAKAYVATLDRMAKGLHGRQVIVIGVGDVGSAAISNLILRKAKPIAVDVDKRKIKALSRRFDRKVLVFDKLTQALGQTNLILNTAPARNIILADMIKENTLISAPAIPVGLTQAALRKVGGNLVHDPLQLGVAAMGVEACAN
jgi:pyrrolysine biosynthesis protein PylD